MGRLIVAVLFILSNIYVYRYFATEDTIPDRQTFMNFPLAVSGWQCEQPGEMGDDVLRKLGVTDYLLCDFTNSQLNRVANVYIGYHASQTRDAAGKETLIHPPEHCLPGSGWDIIKSDVVPLDFGVSGEAKRVIIAKGNHRALVYFWYQSRGRVIARNHEKVLYMFMDRALTQRTDGSLVRFTIPVVHGDEQAAEEIFDSLASAVSSLIPEYVPN